MKQTIFVGQIANLPLNFSPKNGQVGNLPYGLRNFYLILILAKIEFEYYARNILIALKLDLKYWKELEW